MLAGSLRLFRHPCNKVARKPISARALRQVLQWTDGITARIFAMFNDLAVAAIQAGTECIDDAGIEAWRPISKPTPAYV